MMSERIPILLTLMVGLTGCGAPVDSALESQREEARTLVSKLSWDAVGCACQVALFVFPDELPPGPVAERLIAIGKPAVPFLVDAIRDPEKGVACHLILTAILEPEKARLSVDYHWEKEDCIGWTYTYNGLSWDWREETDHTVSASSLAQAQDYWRALVTQVRTDMNECPDKSMDSDGQ